MQRQRVKKMRQKFGFWGISHFLITNPADIFYLSGFHGEDSLLLVGPRSLAVYTDGRYTAEVARLGLRYVESAKGLIDARDAALAKPSAVLGYDGDHLSHSQFLRLKNGVRASRLKNLNGPTAHLRIIKDAAELRLMEKARAIAEAAFTKTAAHFKAGVSEKFLAADLEYNMRQLGADGPSFDTIAAIGSNAALPHAIPSDRKLSKNSLLLMDFGVRYRGYCSDQTRMVVCGKLSRRQKAALKVVQEAQDAALAAVAPGVRCSDVDKAAREVIAAAGYGQFFKHSTGHGIGIDVHEAPRVAPSDKTRLQEGMVITIEPGVYFENEFGVRLEEMVLVTAAGGRRLTKLPMVIDVNA